MNSDEGSSRPVEARPRPELFSGAFLPVTLRVSGVVDENAGPRCRASGLRLRVRSPSESGRQPGDPGRPAPGPAAAVPRRATGADGSDRSGWTSPTSAAVQEALRGHASVMSAIPYYYNGAHGPRRGRGRLPLLRSRRQHRDRVRAEEARTSRPWREGRLGHSRLRPRARHGQHPGRRGDPPAGPGGAGQGLRRRPAPAARAAAQLSDRLLARRRARLLHHAVVGAARRQAGAGGRAERARAGGVPRAGRHARGVPHRRRHQHAALRLRGQGRRDGVQDAALSRATSPSCGRSGSWACWTSSRSR